MPVSEGDCPATDYGPLSKQDVAELLDVHYSKLTKRIETCIEELMLSHLPGVSGSAEKRWPTQTEDQEAGQGMDGLCTSILDRKPALQDSASDSDVFADPTATLHDSASEFDLLVEPTDELKVPCEHLPGEHVPGEHVPEKQAPEEHAPEEHVSCAPKVSAHFSQDDPEVDNYILIEATDSQLYLTEQDSGVDPGGGEAQLEKQSQRGSLFDDEGMWCEEESDRSTMIKRLTKEVEAGQTCSASKLIWGGLVAFMNVVNAALAGVRIEYKSVQAESDTVMQTVLDTASLVLCIFFVCELFHRCLTQRRAFFTGSECVWNGLEILLSISMIVDETLRRSGSPFTEWFNIGWLSALRIVTLLKHHSVLQSMPFWHKLHTLVYILQRCCIAVVWPAVIILLLTYLSALALTQRAAEFCVSESVGKDMCKYFGGLEASIFSLLAAVLGGLPWGVLYEEFRNLGVFYTIIFVLFVAMTSLVLLNTLLSAVMVIYQQFAGSKAEDDITMQMRRQREFAEKAMLFFEMTDADFNGNLSAEEFRFALKDERMIALLDSMKVEVFDVDGTFQLLDADRSGFVDLNELIEGLLRISGAARGIDLVRIGHQINSMNSTLERLMQHLQDEDDNVYTRASLTSRASHVRLSSHMSGNFTSLRTQIIHDLQSANPGSKSRIAKVQLRAMSLRELRAIRQTVELLCPDEKWVDSRTQARLSPHDVNLYNLNHHFLCPATLPNGVVFRNVLDLDFFQGQVVTQDDAKGVERAKGQITDLLDEEGSFRLSVIAGSFTDTLPIFIDGESCEQFGMDPPTHLSYKELVASTAMSPVWFCSHWWGERVFDFVACIECHLKLHQYHEEETGYWICAYANDQHDLGLDIGGEVENTSFYKAMAISTGVLVILDSAATAFSRIWCDFEIYKAIRDEKELDVVTVRQHPAKKSYEPRSCILTQNRCPGETSRHKMQRELSFPLKILSHGMSVQLENGVSSVDSDKEAILHIMAQGYSSTSTDFDATLKLAIKKANATLHSYFAQAAWPSAVKRKNVADFDRSRPGTLSLPSILVEDETRKCLALDLSYLEVLSDQDLEFIAQGLPPYLEQLDLDFSNCNLVTDDSVMHLALALKCQRFLCKMVLNFSSCARITDRGVLALAENLPRSLQEVHLHFLACKKISSLSGQAIASGINNSNVQTFSAIFKGSLFNKDFNSLKELKKWIKKEKIPVMTVTDRSRSRVSRNNFMGAKSWDSIASFRRKSGRISN